MPDSKVVNRAHLAWFLGGGLIALLWAYWPSFVDMAERWAHSPEYSHGYLVPLLCLGLLWHRFDRLQMGVPKSPRIGLLVMAVGVAALFVLPVGFLVEWGFLFGGVALIGAGLILRPTEFDPQKFQPSWWGLPLLIGGIVLRLLSAHYYIGWFDQLSLIPCVAGIVLLTLGWTAARWAWPAVIFMIFMVPLPHTLETTLRDPLRKIGTKASTYLMQTVGLPAIANGNTHEVLVGGMTHKIGVTEACSGLSMLMIFAALSTAVAVMIRRPIWEKGVVLLSAVPIALIANVMRITITGLMLYALEGRDVYLGLGNWILFEMAGDVFAGKFFHDWAGYLMPPFALLLMWLELKIMQRLIVIENDAPMSFGIKNAAANAQNADETTPAADTATRSHSNPRDVRAPASIG